MISAWWLLLVPLGATLGFLGCTLLRKIPDCSICNIREAWYCSNCVERAWGYEVHQEQQKGD